MEGLFVKIHVFLLFFTVAYSRTQNPKIYYLHVKSDIKFRFATTLITSKVANSEKNPVEAHFEVTLPDAAFITNFVMEIDGRIYPGEINEKAKAKEKYEKAKKRGQSAGHVAQKPRHTNRFSVDVNVAGESKVTFNLTYQELLERVYGEYEHIIYIDPGQIIEDFQIDVSIQESREITKVSVPPLRNDILAEANIDEGSNALAVIDRPTTKSATIHYAPTITDQKQQSDQGISGLFVVEYDVERKFDAGEVMVVDGYFVHFFAPVGMDPIPKDVLFILDVSSSMSGTKIIQQRDAIDTILQNMHEGDRFNIMEFSTRAQLWRTTILSANQDNIKQARSYAKRMKANGWTDINTAMLKGIDFLNKIQDGKNRMKIIVFLTDGQASKGEQNRETILKNIDKKNVKGLPVFSLAFGNDADYEFVKKVAVKNKGVARKIFEDSDASLQIKGFYDEISSSTLRNVSFRYLDQNSDVSENTTKINFDTFFDGKELVIAGKLSDGDLKVVNLIVTGNGVDGNVELELESDIKSRVPELTKDFEKITERIWSYLTIKQLLETAIGENDATKKKALNDRALELSLKYKFVTPLTSMVVTKPDERDLGTFDENEDAKLALADDLSLGPPPRGSSISRKRRPGLSGSSGGGGGGSRGGGFAHADPLSLGPPPRGSSISRKRRPGLIATSAGGNRGGGSGGGGSRGGGGGGDPHFMLRINGVEFPVCFDIIAHEGDVLQMLKDPITGVTINGGIIGSTAKNMYGDFKTFIGEFVILTPSVHIHIKPNDIIFNGASLSWNDENVFKMEGIKMYVTINGTHNRILQIDLGNNIVIGIKRNMMEDTKMAVNYLNMYIENEAGISNMAGGILGQFVHKKTTLFKVTLDHHGRQHGHFRETEDKHNTHFTTILHKKPNILTGEMIECWNAHKKVEGLLDGELKDYFVSDITMA